MIFQSAAWSGNRDKKAPAQRPGQGLGRRRGAKRWKALLFEAKEFEQAEITVVVAFVAKAVMAEMSVTEAAMAKALVTETSMSKAPTSESASASEATPTAKATMAFLKSFDRVEQVAAIGLGIREGDNSSRRHEIDRSRLGGLRRASGSKAKDECRSEDGDFHDDFLLADVHCVSLPMNMSCASPKWKYRLAFGSIAHGYRPFFRASA